VTGVLQRLDAQTLSTYRTERRVRRTLAGGSAGHGPIVAGPWTGEHGYEALYWIPFLRWAIDRYAVNPERVVAVARPGMASCYTGIAGRVVAASDVGRLGLSNAVTWRPTLISDLFGAFWSGRRSLDFFFRHTDFRYETPAARTTVKPECPADYAAVELYTGNAISESADNRALLDRVLERVAARMPVVMLDGASHDDAARVISGARLFAGTCGGFAWLAPFLGVETVALYDDGAALSTHLYAARYAYRKSRAARFSVLNIRALRSADCALDTVS
jgi:hypothetical protein